MRCIGMHTQAYLVVLGDGTDLCVATPLSILHMAADSGDVEAMKAVWIPWICTLLDMQGIKAFKLALQCACAKLRNFTISIRLHTMCDAHHVVPSNPHLTNRMTTPYTATI